MNTTLTESSYDFNSPAFHGLAGEIIQHIEPHSEADPLGMLLQFLVAFGNVVGRNGYFTVESDRHYTNLNAVLVGDSSNGRKGTSWNNILRIFEFVDPDWKKSCVKSGLSSGEGLIHHVRDKLEDDPGIPDKRLLTAETEFASVLKVLSRDGNTLSAVIRNAWDTGDLTTLTKNSPAKATGAHLSIIGHVTKAELDRYLSDTEAANGFANRFLWIRVKRSKILPRGGRIEGKIFETIHEQVRERVRFAKKSLEVPRDEKANELWDHLYRALTEEKTGLLGAMTARAAPQVMRLALVYALLDGSSIITEVHLYAANALWEHSFESCQYLFGKNLGDPLADEIYRMLLSNPSGVTREEIRDYFQRNKNRSQIERALGELVRNNLAECRHENLTGGRPAERWLPLPQSTTLRPKCIDAAS